MGTHLSQVWQIWPLSPDIFPNSLPLPAPQPLHTSLKTAANIPLLHVQTGTKEDPRTLQKPLAHHGMMELNKDTVGAPRGNPGLGDKQGLYRGACCPHDPWSSSYQEGNGGRVGHSLKQN